MPPGEYRITRSLTLESTLLLGLEAGGFAADTRPLPRLIVGVHTPQPCLIAKTGASVHGFELDFRRPTPDTVFGPGVKVAGGGVSLSNLLLHNPTQGIVADGSVNCGRLNLANIFLVNPAEIGIRFENGKDVVTFRNVHVWSYLPDSQRICTGFLIGQVDEIRLSDCSVFAAAFGFHFVESELPGGGAPGAPGAPAQRVGSRVGGSIWGGMSNCTVDFAAVAVQVDHANVLRISGGSFWAHHFGLVCDGPGDVLVSGADLRANSHQCIDVPQPRHRHAHRKRLPVEEERRCCTGHHAQRERPGLGARERVPVPGNEPGRPSQPGGAMRERDGQPLCTRPAPGDHRQGPPAHV